MRVARSVDVANVAVANPAHEAPPSPDPTLEETLPLDKDELRQLEIFHRSFNLPGLRLGLVRPVCTEDYLPEEDESARGASSCETESEAARELSALLAQTHGLREQVCTRCARAKAASGSSASRNVRCEKSADPCRLARRASQAAEQLADIADEVAEDVIGADGPDAAAAAALSEGHGLRTHQRHVRPPSNGSMRRPGSGARPLSGTAPRVGAGHVAARGGSRYR